MVGINKRPPEPNRNIEAPENVCITEGYEAPLGDGLNIDFYRIIVDIGYFIAGFVVCILWFR